MLVPVAGTFDPQEVNRRSVPKRTKALVEQDPKKFPPVYLFNVGPYRHEFPPNDRGARYLEACPTGKAHSEPMIFRNIEMTVYDLADGGGNMAWHDEDGMELALALIHSGAKLSLDTANLEWRGVFATENEKPTQKELGEARGKLQQYMRLTYDQGSELIQQGARVLPGDRTLYNEAAAILGKPSLFGVADHTMDRCVFCKNTILEGAIICTHCHSRLDSDEAKNLKAKKTA